MILILTEDMFIDFRERERENKKHHVREKISCFPFAPPPGIKPNLGMCPEQRSNPQPFGVREDAPIN